MLMSERLIKQALFDCAKLAFVTNREVKRVTIIDNRNKIFKRMTDPIVTVSLANYSKYLVLLAT